MLAGVLMVDEQHLGLGLVGAGVVGDLAGPDCAPPVRGAETEQREDVGMVERGLLQLGHHLGVVVVGRVGGRKDFEEFRLRPELDQRKAQPLQGPGLTGCRLDQDVVVADLEDVRAGGGDGGAGAGVEDVRDLVGFGVFGGLGGGGRGQDEPHQQHERQPEKGWPNTSGDRRTVHRELLGIKAGLPKEPGPVVARG